jgi:predicted metalloprotease with PDZ domain
MFIFRVLLGVVLAVTSSIAASAVECYTILDNPKGKCLNSECSELCVLSVSAISRGDLTPGFMTNQKSGSLVVVAVVPHSPAQRADVRVGDELLSVDGISAPFKGDKRPTWQSATTHLIILRRDRELLSKEVASVSTDALIASLPALTDPLTPVEFSGNFRSPLRAAPFMSGLKVHRDGTDLVVDSVLLGSPAAEAGIRPGDVLSDVGLAPARVQYSSYREILDLRVKRGYNARHVKVKFASLTDILDGSSEQ